MIVVRSLMMLLILGWGALGPLAAETTERAHSAILFIGDGMGLAQVNAARQALGKDARLAMESLPVTGLVRTASSNSSITDSAAAGTALACGYKTRNGYIGISDPLLETSGTTHALQNLTQLALAAGKSVGLVTTTRVTHATPACFYAHDQSRGNENEIATQVADSGLTLLLGGGRMFFHPTTWLDPETTSTGGRTDGRDLAGELTSAGWTMVENAAALQALDPANPNLRVLGLFDYDHMEYDRLRAGDPLGDPALSEMVTFAINLLSRNPNGYFMMVEGGRIDHAGHANDIDNNIGETQAFDRAIGQALATVDHQTLVVVTADHETGGLTLVGNAWLPLDLSPILAWSTKQHTGIDVPLYAGGAGAAAFGGVQENTEVHQRLATALGLNAQQPASGVTAAASGGLE